MHPYMFWILFSFPHTRNGLWVPSAHFFWSSFVTGAQFSGFPCQNTTPSLLKSVPQGGPQTSHVLLHSQRGKSFRVLCFPTWAYPFTTSSLPPPPTTTTPLWMAELTGVRAAWLCWFVEWGHLAQVREVVLCLSVDLTNQRKIKVIRFSSKTQMLPLACFISN